MNATEKNSTNRLSLVIILLLLGIVGVLSYLQFTSTESIASLEKDKEILRYDLRDYISRYDAIETDNDSLRSVISRERDRLVDLLDSVNTLRDGDLAKLKRLNNELYRYKLENSRLRAVADSLQVANQQLKLEKQEVEEALEVELVRTSELSQERAKLSRDVARGSVLQATAVNIDAFRVRSNGNESGTRRASRVDRIKACFTLGANSLAKAGEVAIYMRITSDSNKVIVMPQDKATKQTFDFNQNPMLYSAKKIVVYQNIAVNDCISMDVLDGEKLEKGVYTIELYTEEYKITEARIELN
ncbi:MAG: hypothetical protein LAT76_01915 [Schleiferiaceae bacterium]|nr:hypothetical protein [Schleiferiaceae bacterium]